MEKLKQELIEAGVIGRIVDDFNPHLDIYVHYGDKRIRLGEELSFADVQNRPSTFEFRFDPHSHWIAESYWNPKFTTMIMTDPDVPGGEYLHGLYTDVFSIDRHEGAGSFQYLIGYEPPRSVGISTMAFTLFGTKEPLNYVPSSRENFSTRGFADVNALGPPVAATLLKIKNENKEETQAEVNVLGPAEAATLLKIKNDNQEETQGDVNALGPSAAATLLKLKNDKKKESQVDVNVSPTCSTVRSYSKLDNNEDESTSKPKRPRII